MSLLLLEDRFEAAKAGGGKLKRSFFASLALHGSFFLMLFILASIPHKFHFEQTALIELQGIKAAGGIEGDENALPKIPNASSKSPKTATLKPKAQRLAAAPKINTQTQGEKISLSPKSKPPVARIDLKEKILQKLSARGGGQPTGSKNVQSTTKPGVGTIGTDIPFPFADYLAEVQNRISGLWEEPSSLSTKSGNMQAVVVFRIHRNGSIGKVLLAIPSGVASLDKSAVQAVEAANPLPGLPAEFKNDYLDVHLQFDLTR